MDLSVTDRLSPEKCGVSAPEKRSNRIGLCLCYGHVTTWLILSVW